MTLLHGDCLEKLSNVEENSIDLIYLDPPFFSQKTQRLSARDAHIEFSFSDSWKSIEEYRCYITERLSCCCRVLKNTGSIFLHCDSKASHHLRIALDEVFGPTNFQSEIIWTYKRWSNSRKGLLPAHQSILFYSKTKHFKFNPMWQNYSETTNLDQIFQERTRDERGKSSYKSSNGNNVIAAQKKGVPLSDVWEIPFLNPKACERVGYPTQKPIILLERIIELATDQGDIVLDPFCGSGTTLVAASIKQRKYIGIDISEEALDLAKKRLLNPVRTESHLMKRGIDSYRNQTNEIISILREIGAEIVHRNKGIDGFLSHNGTILPVPIRVRRDNETVEDAVTSLLKSCKKNKFHWKVVFSNPSKNNELFSNQDSFKAFFVKENLIIVNNAKELREQLPVFINTISK